MVQMHEDQPSFASQFMKSNLNTGLALAQALMGQHLSQKQSSAENEALKRMGIDLSGIQDPELRKSIVNETLKGQRSQKKVHSDLKERGRGSIQDMRKILARGKTGWNFLNYATEEGRADRAAMDTAALNLERLAVEMQGKGTLSKPRFEYMVKRLPSSSKSDAENNAILDEWENILSESESENKSESGQGKKVKFDSNNPEHAAKYNQLVKKYGQGSPKVNEILFKEFTG